MEGLDSIARRYGVLPSVVINMRNPVKAVTVNLWAHNWGVQKDARDLREAHRQVARGRRGR